MLNTSDTATMAKDAAAQSNPTRCVVDGKRLTYLPELEAVTCPACHTTIALGITEPESHPVASEEDFTRAEEGSHDWGASVYSHDCATFGTVYRLSGGCCGHSGKGFTEEKEAPLAPNAICPFRITRETAAKAIPAFFKKKLMAPICYKTQVKPEELIACYVPGWLFSTQTIAKYSATFGVDRADKDRYGRAKTSTDWYPVAGTFVEDYENQLVWAAERLDDEQLQQLQPYKMADCRAFNGAYLSYCPALKNVLPLPEAWKRAHRTIADTLLGDLRYRVMKDKGAHHLKDFQHNAAYTNLRYSGILLPVYVLKRKFLGKEHFILVNGETGKVAEKAPTSPLGALIAVAAGLGVLFLLLLWSGM